MRQTAVAKRSTLIVGALLGAVAAATVTAKEELGHVHFQVSCTAEAQQKFHHAMALYHSFG